MQECSWWILVFHTLGLLLFILLRQNLILEPRLAWNLLCRKPWMNGDTPASDSHVLGLHNWTMTPGISFYLLFRNPDFQMTLKNLAFQGPGKDEPKEVDSPLNIPLLSTPCVRAHWGCSGKVAIVIRSLLPSVLLNISQLWFVIDKWVK